MDQRILYTLIADAQIITSETIRYLLNEIEKYFIPVNMRLQILTKGKKQKYNRSKMDNGLEKELSEKRVQISVSDEKNTLDILKSATNPNVITLLLLLDSGINPELDPVFDNIMTECGIVAFKCSAEDDFWQNCENLLSYEAAHKDLTQIHKTKRANWLNDEIADIEYNPGHSHRVNGIWFGAVYRMWFGKPYYQYIGKDILVGYQKCYENIELENEVLRITLYADLWDYEKPEHRALQWDFRQRVGMDTVTRNLL